MTAPNKVIYASKVKSSGGREDGKAESADGKLKVKLSKPSEMGGDNGAGTNPEQLFGAAYSACFLGALKAVAGKEKVTIPNDAYVEAEIGFGPLDHGYAITASLSVHLPELDKATAQSIMEKAHQVCPYSNATRGNVDVKLKLV